MKEMAEEYLGQTVINAVLKVPANFNFHQKQVINDEGTKAELKVLRIINESTSASIAYGFNHNTNYEDFILVFDLGGGTLNVSLVAIEAEVVEVKATAGNNNLGGDDFDNILLNYCCEEFMHQQVIDITKIKNHQEDQGFNVKKQNECYQLQMKQQLKLIH